MKKKNQSVILINTCVLCNLLSLQALKELNHLDLEVPMNTNQDWTVDKTHVQVAFRLQVSSR